MAGAAGLGLTSILLCRFLPPDMLPTCDASIAPLEAPVQGSGLRGPRSGSGTGVAG